MPTRITEPTDTATAADRRKPVAETPLAKAERELADLMTEQAGLNGRLGAAAHEGDALTLLQLRRRAEEISTEVWAARVSALRLKVVDLKAREPALSEQAATAAALWQSAKLALDEAQSQFNEAQNACYDNRDEAMNLQEAIDRAEKQLFTLTSEQRPDLAPVVRSLRHMPAVST